jgi:uncharacterized protein (DUF302 family)
MGLEIEPKDYRSFQVQPDKGVRTMPIDGLITIRSNHGPKDTMSRLEGAVKLRGLTVFARIDHAAGAAAAGLDLPPTEVLIFGNARGGTPLMHAAQTIGIDLPLKALVWQDPSGTTWISYNDPAWLARRHELGRATDEAVHTLSAALESLVNAATGPAERPVAAN